MWAYTYLSGDIIFTQKITRACMRACRFFENNTFGNIRMCSFAEKGGDRNETRMSWLLRLGNNATDEEERWWTD